MVKVEVAKPDAVARIYLLSVSMLHILMMIRESEN